MKKATFAIILAALILTGCGAKSKEYPHSGIVTDVNEESNIVTVTDFVGRSWQFSGAEDWMIGDIAAMIMDDNGTPDNVFDDKITAVQYCGWIN